MKQKTAILILVAVGLLLYLNSLINGFIGDDRLQILENPNIHAIQNIPSLFTKSTYYTFQEDSPMGLYFRPVMMTVFTLIFAIFKEDPLYFHLVQIFFHIANAILVYLLFKKLVKPLTTFFLSLIFLVHPINSEAVLYIANLQDTLFLFFGLLALLLVMSTNTVSFARFCTLILLLTLCLLSKEAGILFLAICLAYAFLQKKGQVRKAVIVATITVSCLYLFLRFSLAHMQFAQIAIAPIANAPLPIRLLTVPAILIHYAATFLFPKDVLVSGFWLVREPRLESFYLPLLISFFLFFVIFAPFVWLCKKKDKVWKQYGFFLFWFVAGLLLHLNILTLAATVADRWFYFPIIGLLGMIGVGIEASPHFTSKNFQRFFLSLSIIVIIALSIRTFVRTFDWRDAHTLYTHDLAMQKDNFFLQNSLGAELIEEGRFTEAKPFIENSIANFPFFGNINNLAIIYLSQGDSEKAKVYVEKALALGDNYAVYQNYSNLLLAYDTPQKTKEFTKEALRRYPNNPKLWLNAAHAEYLLGNKLEAIQSAQTAYGLGSMEANDLLERMKQNQPLEIKRK